MRGNASPTGIGMLKSLRVLSLEMRYRRAHAVGESTSESGLEVLESSGCVCLGVECENEKSAEVERFTVCSESVNSSVVVVESSRESERIMSCNNYVRVLRRELRSYRK